MMLFIPSKKELLLALERIRISHCAYGGGSTCDCKFGAWEGLEHGEEKNGCPELYVAIRMLMALNTKEYKSLEKKLFKPSAKTKERVLAQVKEIKEITRPPKAPK